MQVEVYEEHRKISVFFFLFSFEYSSMSFYVLEHSHHVQCCHHNLRGQVSLFPLFQFFDVRDSYMSPVVL